MRLKKLFFAFGALPAAICLLAAPGGAQYYIPAYASPRAAALGPWPWNFDIGGGPAWVAGPARDKLTDGSVFTFGAGYNATPRAGFVVEFTSLGLGLQDSVIQQNQAVDGDAGIWALTFDPIWRYRIGGPVGGYIIGGGGFYERDIRLDQPTTFTVPTSQGPATFSGINTVHQYDDTGGVNIGTGITWNVSWGTKIFLEVRYHYIFTYGTPTQIVPLTFGLRW